MVAVSSHRSPTTPGTVRRSAGKPSSRKPSDPLFADNVKLAMWPAATLLATTIGVGARTTTAPRLVASVGNSDGSSTVSPAATVSAGAVPTEPVTRITPRPQRRMLLVAIRAGAPGTNPRESLWPSPPVSVEFAMLTRALTRSSAWGAELAPVDAVNPRMAQLSRETLLFCTCTIQGTLEVVSGNVPSKPKFRNRTWALLTIERVPQPCGPSTRVTLPAENMTCRSAARIGWKPGLQPLIARAFPEGIV